MNGTRVNRRTLLLGLAAVALTGCGEDASADEPPKVSYGSDLCARCRMIVSEERFAAGLVDGEGEATVFDDAGELVATVQDEGLNERRVWVHDYGSSNWLDGTAAFFVASPTAMTPMGTGVLACEARAAADEFAAANQGTVMTWDQILRDWEIEARMS